MSAASLSSAHLTLLADPLCECWSSARCSVFLVWLSLHCGTHWEGAGGKELRGIGGGAAETVGVTGVVGTDWLISHSHLQGIKDRGVGKGFGRVCMCVRVWQQEREGEYGIVGNTKSSDCWVWMPWPHADPHFLSQLPQHELGSISQHCCFFCCPQSCGHKWESTPRTSLSSGVNNDKGVIVWLCRTMPDVRLCDLWWDRLPFLITVTIKPSWKTEDSNGCFGGLNVSN